MFPKNQRQFIRLILSLTALMGMVVLVAFLRLPSEPENQILFGLSGKRLGLGMILLLILAFNVVTLLWISMKPGGWRERIEGVIAAWLKDHLAWAVVTLHLLTVMTGIFLLAVFHPVNKTLAFLEPFRPLLGGPSLWLFFSSLILTVFFRISHRETLRENKPLAVIDYFILVVLIFGITYYSYKHILIWAGAENQKSYAYWNLLADEFLKGRLYLETPQQTHDLTLYRGDWYVPPPPLPAVLMMPLAYLIGGENINTSTFSIFFSSINTVLVFLILEQLSRHKWIKLSRTGILLLVVLFAFGNPHLWVGIRGRMWFVSQIVTVTFLALAVFAALKSWSPWLVGISIGLAITARPNGIMTWFFVLAIAMQILKEKNGNVSFKQLLNWCIKSTVPLGAAVAGLLFYNYARFDNFLDFGYTTISGDPTIVFNAQTYGIFSPHYILTNLKIMFLYFPAIQPGSRWPILPSTMGMSIFLATPPLIYLFRRYERQWWIIGAWATVFLNFLLLVLYHNTGAHQFGYRYILDAIVPLIAMLAVALGKKVPWHFILLLMFSIAFNVYGAYWFING